ncbi:hypothetical protein H4219_000276 [Mycoemilia scoparia]|uniref:Mitochondrial inner membrane protease subunit 2 n=1 Tax=Mycoemilia scoparia TaxID=417184 RepID=A0A9W8A378_9FUNG|nr:hypothetical protein H4219_000276 [Mycoemilia scoparia]
MWAPVAIFIADNVISVARIKGREDVVLLNKWSVGWDSTLNLKKGDIVTLWSPSNPERLITKRIIAMPGDCVVPLPVHSEGTPSLVRIPKGHCWVEGDESLHSVDSNTFGPVPLGIVNSKVGFVIWPPSRFGSINSNVPDWKRKRIYESGLTPYNGD